MSRYKESPRFGNIATADLIERELEARAELAEMQNTIRARLIAESGIVVGQVYRIADDGRPLAGRLLWVEGVGAGLGWLGIGVPRAAADGKGFTCFAWGRLNGKSTAGDGWGIKRQNVSVGRLTLEGTK